MGKTADLTVVQKTIIDTLHKEGTPQTLLPKAGSQSAVSHVNRKLSGRKKCGRKRCTTNRENQTYEDCQAKSIQEFGWTSQGMDWGWGQGIKSYHTQTCQGRRLTWAKEKKNWTVAQWSKVLFSDESKFCISFVNQGPRVWMKGGEAHSPSCLKSSVKFPQSVTIWGAMSSEGVGADFIFQQDLAPAHTAKSMKSWLNDHGVGVCLTGQKTHQTFSMGYCQEENEKQETKKCRWAEGHCQRNLGFHTTSAVTQTDHLHATPNWSSN